MATNNQRLSSLETQVQELQAQLGSVSTMQQGFDSKMEQMMKNFDTLLNIQRQQLDPNNIGNQGPPSISILGPYENAPKGDKSDDIFRSIKFEFPKFDGNNPRSWVRRCNKLFAHHVVHEHQKIYLSTMNLEGEAEAWYSGFVQHGKELTWAGLVEEIFARISLEASENLIGELKKLQQYNTVDEYRSKFEELKGWALARNPSLNKAFFMDCFLGGLKVEIQLGVQELKPRDLKELIRLSRVEEEKLEAWLKRSRGVNRMSANIFTPKTVSTFFLPKTCNCFPSSGQTCRNEQG